jgi:hypothetical protein
MKVLYLLSKVLSLLVIFMFYNIPVCTYSEYSVCCTQYHSIVGYLFVLLIVVHP